MKNLLLFIMVVLLSGCSSILPECDFVIEGEACHWGIRTFHIGKLLHVDGKTFLLPEEVCELNASAWKADFNGDGKHDYLLSVAGMGNGKNFGNGVLYVFLSGNSKYQCLRQEYKGWQYE